MDKILAFDNQSLTLFRQRVTTIVFNRVIVPYDPSTLTTHLLDAHNGGSSPVSSLVISNLILQKQINSGFTSDKINGKFMNAFNSVSVVRDLDYPASGAAWLYFLNVPTTFFALIPPIPLTIVPGEDNPLLISNNSIFPFNTTYLLKSQPIYGTTYNKYRLIRPIGINTTASFTLNTLLLTSGFSQVSSNVWEANINEIPGGTGSGGWVPLSSIWTNTGGATTVFPFKINGDSLEPGDSRIFTESSFLEQTGVATMLQHMATYPHYGIDDKAISQDKCFSAAYLSQTYSIGRYSNMYGGDSWIESGNQNRSHPVEEVPPDTLVTWVALYNGEEPGKKVVAPDGTLLARPVNNRTKIRCAFQLPANVTPVADTGVLLRRLNPTWGFKPGIA